MQHTSYPASPSDTFAILFSVTELLHACLLIDINSLKVVEDMT